jgi:hypothetical protein
MTERSYAMKILFYWFCCVTFIRGKFGPKKTITIWGRNNFGGGVDNMIIFLDCFLLYIIWLMREVEWKETVCHDKEKCFIS